MIIFFYKECLLKLELLLNIVLRNSSLLIVFKSPSNDIIALNLSCPIYVS